MGKTMFMETKCEVPFPLKFSLYRQNPLMTIVHHNIETSQLICMQINSLVSI